MSLHYKIPFFLICIMSFYQQRIIAQQSIIQTGLKSFSIGSLNFDSLTIKELDTIIIRDGFISSQFEVNLAFSCNPLTLYFTDSSSVQLLEIKELCYTYSIDNEYNIKTDTLHFSENFKILKKNLENYPDYYEVHIKYGANSSQVGFQSDINGLPHIMNLVFTIWSKQND